MKQQQQHNDEEENDISILRVKEQLGLHLARAFVTIYPDGLFAAKWSKTPGSSNWTVGDWSHVMKMVVSQVEQHGPDV